MKGSIYYPRRVVQTNGDVFWPNKLTSDVSDHDK